MCIKSQPKEEIRSATLKRAILGLVLPILYYVDVVNTNLHVTQSVFPAVNDENMYENGDHAIDATNSMHAIDAWVEDEQTTFWMISNKIYKARFNI